MSVHAPKACLEPNPSRQSVLFGGVYINELALSRAQNISQAHISRVLNGTRTPSMQIALKLAAGLGLTIDQLLNNIEERKETRDLAEDEIIARHEARLKREARADRATSRAGRIPAPRLLGRKSA